MILMLVKVILFYFINRTGTARFISKTMLTAIFLDLLAFLDSGSFFERQKMELGQRLGQTFF